MSLIVDQHREYLADRARLDAYGRAMAAMVRPRDVVLDLGAGTGILGLMACRAGAARVYAVEETDLVDLARRVAAANGFGDRIVHVKGHSWHVSLPEPVDLVVCDQTGWFGVDGSVLQDLDDARRRLVKPEGRTIPSSLEVMLAPVESAEAYAAVEFWESRPAGFDLAMAREVAANTGYPRFLRGDDLLAAPAVSDTLDLSLPPPTLVRIDAHWTMSRGGTFLGLGAWFAATLAPGVVLTNSPLAPDRINRRQTFFPIEHPVPVAAGDVVRASWRVQVEELIASWQVVVEPRGAGGRREQFAHSTLKGMLLDREVLERSRPCRVPRLTPRGRARRAVLELADGERSLSEIEHVIGERYPDLFRSPRDAAVFVAEVLARDAE